MKSDIPELDRFRLEEPSLSALGQGGEDEIRFRVELHARRPTRRVVVALLDESRRQGMAVAIYPATGEVCDLSQGGGVIGYLSAGALDGGEALRCELLLESCGCNFIAAVRVQGEHFLYPAFVAAGDVALQPWVGEEILAGPRDRDLAAGSCAA